MKVIAGAVLAACVATGASALPFDTEMKLTAADAAARDEFGYSVAISGDTAIVGTLRFDDGGSVSGSAYLFDVTTGNEILKLTASDAVTSDRFGSSVAISNNTAIVGAYFDDDGGSDSGSAYLYTSSVPLPAAAWMLIAGLSGLGLMRRRGA